MVGQATSRNHQLIVEATYSVRLCQFRNCFTKNSSSFFLKLGKLDKEVIVTGREFQILGS